MLKKKNNLICIIAIIITLITGITTIKSASLAQPSHQNNIEHNNQNSYNTYNYSNNYDHASQISQQVTPASSNELETISILVTCSLIFSLSSIYLIMSKFSQHNIFINRDKKIIYILASCILTVVITYTSIATINNSNQSPPNNDNDPSIIYNNFNYFEI